MTMAHAFRAGWICGLGIGTMNFGWFFLTRLGWNVMLSPGVFDHYVWPLVCSAIGGGILGVGVFYASVTWHGRRPF